MLLLLCRYGTLVHCGERLYCVSRVGVDLTRLRVDLSTWLVGREKETWNAEWTVAAMLLVLCDRVRWAIGCVSVGGVGSAVTFGGAATLGSVATTLGSAGWVTLTLGGAAWRATWVFGGGACVVSGVNPTLGVDGVLYFKLKIALRLSTARSCALQLSGVRSALTAMVSARRQWMILSAVVSVGTDSVGCWKTTVSEMMTADVEDLMSLWHR